MIRGKPALADTKSLLAKLMAQENVTVIHENLPTAYFDLQNRELHCPLWKDMSPELYDLLMGHEISHALHTPKEGWHNAINTCKKVESKTHKHDESCYDINFKDFLNVCEDARIEKMIKRVFPGLQPSFTKAYIELWERDFFGVKELKDLSHLMLIDRINIHFKRGAIAGVRFSKEEQPYVDQLDKAETWAEVEEAARALYKWSNDNEQDKKQLIKTLDMLKKFLAQGQKGDPDPNAEPQEGSGEGDGEGDGESRPGEGQEGKNGSSQIDQNGKPTGGDQKGKDGKGATSGDLDGKDKGKEGKQKSNGPLGGRSNGAQSTPRSITDQSFRRHEVDLTDKAVKGWIANVTLPKPALAHIIYDNASVVKFFEDAIANDMRGFTGDKSYQSVSQNILNAFLTRNKNYINLLVKEFEMRKNATQYYRAKVSRTGEIDTNLLARYKFSNDIFRRITETPKGKNHGLIMFLDMSGSMDGSYMRCAVEQIITLVTFCNKVAIPFDVYGFADSNNYQAKYGQKFSSERRDLQVNGSGFHLRTLISSSTPNNLQKRALKMLAYFAATHTNNNQGYTLTEFDRKIKNFLSGNRTYSNHGLTTHGTPLSETIIASRAIIDQFKMNHKSDIVNVVYLTDGDGAQCTMPHAVTSEVRKQSGSQIGGIVIQDPITRHQVTYAPKTGENYTLVQDALVRAVAEITGCRHLGFYIGAASSIRSHIGNRGGLNTTQVAAARKQLDEKGYCSVPAQGFHNYFYVSTEMMGYEDKFTGREHVGSGTQNSIENQFKDNQKNKAASRAMLGAFAQDIATQDGLND